ncbi:MAG: tRNA (guanosine(37)-N1)-methyltransferase TrmD [Helicobacteraceae bacterium]|jgi:tRNA (guanine37-N1)-methyltransferase|nr:tRNA (guanosine(37)-N1)-methyltransferase TrmD [Helicobacteraceae bacterium]
MRFSFITIFENLIAPYFNEAILKKAIDKKLLEIEIVNPRDYSADKWQKTDDTVTGGGAGMVMTPQPLFDSLADLRRKSPKVKILFMTPCAKRFGSRDAKRLAAQEHIAFVCGRYEGFDERAIEVFADEVFSIGDFVLTGGELPAIMMCDAIARFVSGTLGNERSALTDSFENAALESPSFTKPTLFRGYGTPSELLSGNHKAIDEFRSRLSALKTRYFRPDLT